MVAVLLIALALAVAIHWYLWRRLVADTTRRGSWGRRIGTAAMVTAVPLLLAALVGSRALPVAAARVPGWPGYLWLALMFYLLLGLLALELPRLGVRRLLRGRATGGSGVVAFDDVTAVAADGAPGAARPAGTVRCPDATGTVRYADTAGTAGPAGTVRHDGPGCDPRSTVDEGRRLLLSRSVAIAAGLAAAGTVGFGTVTALRPPVRRRVPIPIAKLPRRLDGLGIAVVSDIHLGPLLGRSHAQRVVDAVNSLDADIVAVVGDLVDGTVAELGGAAEPLRGLRSRLGAYFVTGNHEYYSGFRPWIEMLPSLGLRVLRNERVELDGLDLAGVNDATGDQHGDPPDYDRALRGRDRSRPVVLLAHQPVQAVEAARRGVDLQLSGHTHGGQLWPFGAVVRLQQPVLAGLGRVDGMPVYVTRGAGSWGPPVRVGAPPDVTLVTLHST